MDLKGRLSNPLDIPETPAAQGLKPTGDSSESAETARFRPSDDHAEERREEEGRLSIPPQRRLSPAAVEDLIAAYQAGATVTQLAVEFGIHRTTVTGHLDRHGVPRHSGQTAWDDKILNEAADLYESGLSLADVADRYEIDPQTVANRFRRSGVPVRPQRGSSSRVLGPQDLR